MPHRKLVRGIFFPTKQDDAPKMLDGGANSASLKATDIRGSKGSRQVRILREGLKTLRDGVSLGNRKNKGAATLYHRGGSEETRVRNVVKRGWLMIDVRVECCRSGLRRGKRLSAWPLARAA